MLAALKSLVVVLVLSGITFHFAKPLCLNFMRAEDFDRRRKVWFILTICGFLAPNLWVFAAVAMPVVYWATAKDPHPTALYLLLLLTVPPVTLPIPLPVINKLFDLSTYRILALALLIPAMLRLANTTASRSPGLVKADLIVLAFGLWQLALYVPYESLTNTMRRGFLYFVDVYALYYVFSRGAVTKAAMRDTLACFCLVCAVLAPITAFEAAKGWLLYEIIPKQWGDPNEFAWLMRDGALRAQASAGHSLAMGYLFAAGLGYWLYCGNSTRSRRLLWAVGGLLFGGLIATASRAPMLVGGLVVVIYLVAAPAGRRGLLKTVIAFAVIAVPLSMTSVGERVINTLPFIGTSEQFNVTYRQRLAEISWRLIMQNPIFGDPFVMRYMEDLRQGQGIIDLVNTYASVALFYGLVGCGMFVLCFVYPMLRSIWAARAAGATASDDADLGAALVAVMLGTLVFMVTASFGTGLEIMAWALAGLCSAYPAVVRHGLLGRQDLSGMFTPTAPTASSLKPPRFVGRGF